MVAGASADVPIAPLAAAQAAIQNSETVADADSEPEGMIVKSPLVGTFMQHLPRMPLRLFRSATW